MGNCNRLSNGHPKIAGPGFWNLKMLTSLKKKSSERTQQFKRKEISSLSHHSLLSFYLSIYPIGNELRHLGVYAINFFGGEFVFCKII